MSTTPNFERNDLDIHFFRYSGCAATRSVIRGRGHLEAATWEARLLGGCHLRGTATLEAWPPWRHGHSGEAFGGRGNLGARHSGRRKPLGHSGRQESLGRAVRRMRVARGRRPLEGTRHPEGSGAQAIQRFSPLGGQAVRRASRPEAGHPEAGYPEDIVIRGCKISKAQAHRRHKPEAERSSCSPRSPNSLTNSLTTCGCPRTRRACGCRRRCLCGPCA